VVGIKFQLKTDLPLEIVRARLSRGLVFRDRRINERFKQSVSAIDNEASVEVKHVLSVGGPIRVPLAVIKEQIASNTDDTYIEGKLYDVTFNLGFYIIYPVSFIFLAAFIWGVSGLDIVASFVIVYSGLLLLYFYVKKRFRTRIVETIEFTLSDQTIK
jgi:hypothetical protein